MIHYWSQRLCACALAVLLCATSGFAQQAPGQPTSQSGAQPDAIDALVQRAEREYQAGQQNYAAGHLEAAKQNFDNATDILMTGPVDVHADDRLEREFDKIVEGVNQLEMQALQQGDGFTEQKQVQAPIDETNDVTFAVDPNVKQKAEQQLKETNSDLPLVINDYVAGYINYFSTRGKGVIERALVRAGKYRGMIEQTLKEEGVPQDLIYLAQAESGFQPVAVSRVGARGMWQFMASRANGYGLQRSWWVDDRQDPVKATRAAAEHLKDLYKQFGDWYLAIAAYNSGPGNVQQAVKRTGYADFWELYKRNVLPKETKNYVPIILAMTIMAKNPVQYGLTEIVPDPPLTGDVVTVDYPVDLRLVAECIDVPVSMLAEMNPSLLRLTTPKDRPFDLRLPAGTKLQYEDAIAKIPPDKRVWWRYHHVEPGDTLAAVARKYHTTAKAISEVNNLDSDELLTDAKLIIPVAGGRYSGANGEPVAFAKTPTRYHVRKGDTVASVADDFGVPADRVRRWNRIKGNTLKPGRTLLIYKPVAPGEGSTAEGSGRSHHGKRKAKSSSHHSSTTAHSSRTASGKKKSKSATSSATRATGGGKRPVGTVAAAR